MTFDHRQLDPRSKLAFTLAVSGLVIAVPKFAWLAVLGAVVILVVAVGQGIRVRSWLGFLRPLRFLVPAIFLLNLLFYAGGAVLWQFPLVPLTITTGGIETSTRIVVRLIVIAGVAAWFARTTEAEAFEAALARLGVPWSFAFVLSLSLRLVPVTRSRYQTVVDAQRSRGLDFEGGLVSRVRARIPLFIPFFVSIIEYGYEIADALVVRDFGAATRRTSLVRLEHRAPDYVLYAVSGVLVMAVLVAV